MGDLLGSPRVASLLFASHDDRRAEFGAIIFLGPKCPPFGKRITVVRLLRRHAHGKISRFTTRAAGAASIRLNDVHNMSDAIIPALKHRIPSELRS